MAASRAIHPTRFGGGSITSMTWACRHDDAQPFTHWLLEEPVPDAPAGALGAGGFVAFLDEVQGEAFDYMRERGWC